MTFYTSTAFNRTRVELKRVYTFSKRVLHELLIVQELN